MAEQQYDGSRDSGHRTTFTGLPRLMAIDHPDWIFDTICQLKVSFSFEEFGETLKRVSGREIGTHSRFIEMNLYTATSIGLIKSTRRDGATLYSTTYLGEMLCVVRKRGDPEQLESILRQALFSNLRYKHAFDVLIDMVSRRGTNGKLLTRNEIREFFGNETTRTLISFGKAAGIIGELNGATWLIDCSYKEKAASEGFDTEKFYSILKQAYLNYLRSKDAGLAVSRYVEIYKLRQMTLAELRIADNRVFDSMLNKLLDRPDHAGIQLYGTAPTVLPDREDPRFNELTFRRKDKLYFYMTLPVA